MLEINFYNLELILETLLRILVLLTEASSIKILLDFIELFLALVNKICKQCLLNNLNIIKEFIFCMY
jgi:hypothetical protein